MADVGFRVLGLEIRDDVLNGLERGEPHFFEPGLKDMLQRLVKQGRLKFAKHLPDQCDATVFIITVGTPLDDHGRARLDIVANVAGEVAAHLKPNDLVVMRSTLKLGVTRNAVMPLLDQRGLPYDLAFCPERTLEGQALAELRYLPQIVGSSTLTAGVRAAQLFQFVTPTTVRVSGLETAEMIKLVDNAQRDVFFAFSNEIARLCDETGVEVAEVVKAGKLGYPRTNLPMPGPVGGPCLSKDPYILAESFESSPIYPDIVVTSRRTNEKVLGEAVDRLKRLAIRLPGFPEAPTVSLLGLAFKGRPATDDLRGTTARPILDALLKAFPSGRFRGWDAVVGPDAVKAFGLEPASSLEDAMQMAHLAVIANNHPAFAAMNITALAGDMARPGIIYDFWNNFDGSDLNLPAGVFYASLGGGGSLKGTP
jgi:nucleotide sugar dehydrogenase